MPAEDSISLDSRLGSALALEAMERHEEAIAVLARAIRHTPEEALVHLVRARCLSRLGRPAEAREASWLALSLAAEDPGMLETLGDFAEGIGEDAVALRAWTRALSTRGDHPGLREKFAAHVRRRFWRAPRRALVALVPVGALSLAGAALAHPHISLFWALLIAILPPVFALGAGVVTWIAATGRLETDCPGVLRAYGAVLDAAVAARRARSNSGETPADAR